MNESKVTKVTTNLEELKVNAIVSDWYIKGGKEKIAKFVLDPDKIYSSQNGSKAGVYGVYVVISDQKKILMYIGEVGKAGRNFVSRVTEHIRLWIDRSELYAGVKASELKAGYKYEVRILALETDDKIRYRKEQTLIEQLKPYLQYSCFPHYDRSKSHYRGVDLAIFPTYRRRGFVVERDGKFTEEQPVLVLDKIYQVAKEIDLSIYKKGKPDEEVVKLVKLEMPHGSEKHLDIKRFIDAEMGVTGRGYRYGSLVNLLAVALEPIYKDQCAV